MLCVCVCGACLSAAPLYTLCVKRRYFVFACVHVLCGFAQDSQSKQGGYSMHQLQGNKEFGCEKKGYLLKKSDG